MTKKIDFHSHYLSPGFVEHLEKHYDGHGDGVATPSWSVEQALAIMEKEQIDYSLLSISSPSVTTEDKAETSELAEEVNSFAADFSRKYPDKLGFMATLPLPYIEPALKMVDRALDEFGAKGFVLETNSDGLYLGDEKLEPIMAALNTRKALVAIHPTQPTPFNHNINTQTPTPLMEFFFDTTRAVVSLSEHQVFSRYPNITWIIPHAGAVLPIIAQRIDAVAGALGATAPRDNPLALLNQLYFDIAGMVLPYQLPTLMELANPDKILYGADYPYTPLLLVEKLADSFTTSSLIALAQKDKILYQNGLKLLSERNIKF